jgi:hypothetical protein
MASPSPPWGGEGAGVWGGIPSVAVAHLTPPTLRVGPLPLPPEGRRGIPEEFCIGL